MAKTRSAEELKKELDKTLNLFYITIGESIMESLKIVEKKKQKLWDLFDPADPSARVMMDPIAVLNISRNDPKLKAVLETKNIKSINSVEGDIKKR